MTNGSSPASPLLSPDLITTAENTLRIADAHLGTLIDAHTIKLPQPRPDYFASLVRSIIGQQVSVAAAAAVSKRFADGTNLDPDHIRGLDDEQLRSYGLSRQKAGYIRDLAAHFADNPSVYDHLETLSDEDVIAELVRVRGIGEWTAQMFLMFTLARPDVFAPDDVGIQKGMMKAYGWDELPQRKDLIKIAESWRPYRTVASLYLWSAIDTPAAVELW